MRKLFFCVLAVCLGLFLCAFDSTDPAGFTYEDNGDGTVLLTGYAGNDTVLKIPETVDGHQVTAIGESCFAGNITLEKVTVPEGVTALGDYAFECCGNLKKIYLPESLRTVGNGAFSGDVKLYLLDMQDGVEKIGDGAFLNCEGLVSFAAPAALQELGQFAFAECVNLMSVNFSTADLKCIPDRCFYECGALTKFASPYGLESIGQRAFYNNLCLSGIYLPETAAEIGAYSFYGCERLENVTIPCEEVAPYAFACCYQLTYASFSEDLKKIGEGAFSLTKVDPEVNYIPEGAEIDETAFGVPEETEEQGIDTEAAEESAEERIADHTAQELAGAAAAEGFKVISNDEFFDWAETYCAFNQDNTLLTWDGNHYISKYKGQIGHYYIAMTAAASMDPDALSDACEKFGDDFLPMYTMIDHGLETEIRRFRMNDDLLLFTGVYDSQLKAAAGTETVPTLDELKACIGKTFTDPSLTSTTTDAAVSFNFSDTLFVIYAPAENLNAVGSVSMDAYMHTNENEVLLYSGAEYEIMDAGVMSAEIEDYSGNMTTEYRNYVLVRLINE